MGLVYKVDNRYFPTPEPGDEVQSFENGSGTKTTSETTLKDEGETISDAISLQYQGPTRSNETKIELDGTGTRDGLVVPPIKGGTTRPMSETSDEGHDDVSDLRALFAEEERI